MDPISAIANAAGKIVGGALDIFSLNTQKKIVKQEGINLDKLTEQEKIKYAELISNGNYQLASQLLTSKQTGDNATNTTIYIIIGFTFFIVLVVVFLKTKRK